MRIAALMSAFLFLVPSSFAQSRSVWIEDLTTNEVRDAIAAGKTTAIFYASGIHQNGAVVALGKHLFLARYLAGHVAEELGNALVLPINPYAPAGDPIKKTGAMAFPGTMSVFDETFAAMTREIAISSIAAGFKYVMLLGDHGGGEQDMLKKVAQELDAEWKSKGARVHYIPVYPEGEANFREVLTKRNVANDRQTPIDDASEIMSIDSDKKWVRQDKIPPDDRKIVSSELGKTFTEAKIGIAVRHIRSLTSSR